MKKTTFKMGLIAILIVLSLSFIVANKFKCSDKEYDIWLIYSEHCSACKMQVEYFDENNVQVRKISVDSTNPEDMIIAYWYLYYSNGSVPVTVLNPMTENQEIYIGYKEVS